MATDTLPTRRFYLVQRVKRSPLADRQIAGDHALAKLGRNPFGYGQLGVYDLDYMGSAEFEWGAIPDAYDRLAKAKRGIVLGDYEYGGHRFDFLWIKREGEPFDDWRAWVEGGSFVDSYGYTVERQPCEGKETPYELRDRLDGKPEPSWGWRTDVWWALDENVMWAFSEDGHLQKMLESMPGGVKGLRDHRRATTPAPRKPEA